VFSNLMKKTGLVETEAGIFEIKKLPVSFAEHIGLRFWKFETAQDEKGKDVTKPVFNNAFETRMETAVETLAYGLENWPLLLEDETKAPINLTTAKAFAEAAPDIASKVLEEIRRFNDVKDAKKN